MMRVLVGSTNPVKVDCVRDAFSQMFPNDTLTVRGVSADSNVSDQPVGEEETLRGASNRAKNAQRQHEEEKKEDEGKIEYYVGIEGGVDDQYLTAFASIVILSHDGKTAHAKTATFALPPRVIQLMKEENKELGEADDIVFGRTNSKQSNGAVGLLTNDVLTRTSYYTHAVILALIPFANPELYFPSSSSSSSSP